MSGSKRHRKPLFWVGSSRTDLSAFPSDVRLVMGFALHMAQMGEKHPDAIATPKSDADLVKERLKRAEQDYEQRQSRK